MLCVVAVTCILGKQEIPFLGHDETAESHNKGQFLQCMTLLSRVDPFCRTTVYTGMANEARDGKTGAVRTVSMKGTMRFLAPTEMTNFDNHCN